MKRTIAAALAATLLGAPAAAHAKRVRAFAVGPKFDVSWVDTRAHFHDKLFALVDRRLRTKAAPAIQAEAGDVASHLLGPADPARPVTTARDLVALPEDLGLMAIFSGSQGAQARKASSVTEAIVDVLGGYSPQFAYYTAKYPALAQRGIPTRLLAVAATDTFARVAVETYAELAAKYHVWLEGGIDMAQSWQVVCTSKATFKPLPGGVGCDEENAAKVAALRSPDEPARDYAYEATSDKASNIALVFDPQGRLASKQVKTYLTPIELPGQLDLVPGEIFGGLSAVHTPVGTLGFVTSKDAWMPDVTARLDEQHVDLLVQPEFFVGDTIQSRGAWAPDNIQGAGYADVLRHPSFEAMVLPELTGNLFDLSADNQQAIALKPRSTRHAPAGFLVGQPPAPGYARVGDWVVKDPVSPSETIAERRRRLGAAGERMLPKASNPACPRPEARGACPGGQVEDVIFQDVQVGANRPLARKKRRKHGRTPFTVNRPLAPSPNAQRNVALAANARTVVAAYEERRASHDQVLLARSADGARTWSAPIHPTGVAAGTADEWWPALAIGPDGTVWLAWSDDAHSRPAPGGGPASGGGMPAGGAQRAHRVYVVRSTDGGRSFSPPVPADASVAPGIQQLRPAIAATGPSRALVAFVDDRARFSGDDLPQAGIWAVAFDGATPGPAQRLDATRPPADLAKTLAHAWAPSLAARGRKVLATWIGFGTYAWDAVARSSDDGGATWGPEQQVNDTPAGAEALEDTPRAALLSDGSPLVAYTDWAKQADPATKASALYDVVVSRPGGKHDQIDGRGDAHVAAFAPALTPAGSGAVAAWQDHAAGPGDVFAARLRDGRWSRPVRLDDTGIAGVNQWRPALAMSGSSVVAAWEDERDGPAQIFLARAPLPRIG